MIFKNKNFKNENQIILGRKYGRDIIDNTMDSVFIATENISNIFSNSLINKVLTDWDKNTIVLDFKENFYKKTSQDREKFGKIIKISEENLAYNPFWFIKNVRYGLFEKEDLKKYKEIVTEMYEIAEKYFTMDRKYKAYSINLIVAVIYYLIKNNEEVNVNKLADFFSCSKELLESNLINMLNNEKTEISEYIVNFITINNWKIRDEIIIVVNNILEIFKTEENDNILNIKELFKNKYTLYISLSSIEDKISKGKVKFLINQILKNENRLNDKALIILPDFKIFNEVSALKEILFYEEQKIKLLIISNIKNLVKLVGSYFTLLTKRKILLDRESIMEIKYLKDFKKFPIKKKLEQHELLYINKSVLKKINKINCKYDEKYVIKQCLKYIIIILLICLYSDLKFNL